MNMFDQKIWVETNAKTEKKTAKWEHQNFLYGFSLKHNVRLPDLAKSNTEHLLNFECQIKKQIF